MVKYYFYRGIGSQNRLTVFRENKFVWTTIFSLSKFLGAVSAANENTATRLKIESSDVLATEEYARLKSQLVQNGTAPNVCVLELVVNDKPLDTLSADEWGNHVLRIKSEEFDAFIEQLNELLSHGRTFSTNLEPPIAVAN